MAFQIVQIIQKEIGWLQVVASNLGYLPSNNTSIWSHHLVVSHLTVGFKHPLDSDGKHHIWH
jgi:hypothetical protein